MSKYGDDRACERNCWTPFEAQIQEDNLISNNECENAQRVFQCNYVHISTKEDNQTSNLTEHKLQVTPTSKVHELKQILCFALDNNDQQICLCSWDDNSKGVLEISKKSVLLLKKCSFFSVMGKSGCNHQSWKHERLVFVNRCSGILLLFSRCL